ncbi:unnamed protein product [Coccothraustes coccothraustes]
MPSCGGSPRSPERGSTCRPVSGWSRWGSEECAAVLGLHRAGGGSSPRLCGVRSVVDQTSNPADPSSVKKEEEEDRDSPAGHGEAAVPLQLLEIRDGADIHLQPMEEA